jgi:hypothetical protein
VHQFIDKFIAYGLVEELYFILSGVKIKGGFYQLQTLSLACSILRVQHSITM